jgi:HPt (histidine-containing phosphotransfer) domain-containing protein
MTVISNSFINLDYLNNMTGGDDEMFQTMIEMLTAEIPEEIEKMGVLLRDENWADLFQVSHKMKTTLAFVGNDTMTEANRRLEHITRHQEDLHEAEGLVSQLTDISEKVIEELKVAVQ